MKLLFAVAAAALAFPAFAQKSAPWGTTYATNLRLYLQDLTEAQWVKKAKSLNARPTCRRTRPHRSLT